MCEYGDGHDGIPEDPLWDEIGEEGLIEELDPEGIYRRDNEEVIPDD